MGGPYITILRVCGQIIAIATETEKTKQNNTEQLQNSNFSRRHNLSLSFGRTSFQINKKNVFTYPEAY